MILSVQNAPSTQWPLPPPLQQEAKVVNQTGERLDLMVVIYSVHGAEFAHANFFPDKEGNFIVPRVACEHPEWAQASLFWYRRENPHHPVCERAVGFVDFFQNGTYPLGA
ncbi:MAG: hypothetical protein KDK64_00670 [Chlamydiia bacterium]|nr:hypothetical protein [Chlamydiia bacterium]